jgi:integrase
MRIGEIIQLRLADIDFTTNPATVMLRKETTKTRETRITHITLEATKALQDYIAKCNPTQITGKENYLFLDTDENKIERIRERLDKNRFNNNRDKIQATKRMKTLESQLKTLSSEELYARSVAITNNPLRAN